MSSHHRGLVFINKDPTSKQLSCSVGTEREFIYRHVQPLRSLLAKKPGASCRSCRRKGKRSSGNAKQRQAAGDIPSTALNLPSSPTPLPSYRHQLQGIFVEENIAALRHQNDFAKIESFFWIRHLPLLGDGGGGTVAFSFAALASAACGQSRSDQGLIQSAASAYTRALAALRHDLATTHGRVSDQNIAVCLALLMYQFFAPNDRGRREWNVHISGLETLIHARGPKSFQDGLAHALFASSRPSIISASLSARRATFLATGSWRVIPWQKKVKSDYQLLQDCLAAVPGLGEVFNGIAHVTNPSTQMHKRITFLEDSWTTVASIIRWAHALSGRISPTGVDDTTDEILVPLASQSQPFPKSFGFCSMANATMCRASWAALIDIYNMLGLTYNALAVEGHSSVSFTSPPPPCRACSEFVVVAEPSSSSASSSSSPEDASQHDSYYLCTGGNILVRSQRSSVYGCRGASQERNDLLLLAQECRNFAQRLAHLVCMTTQYVIRPDHKAVGRYLTLLPLKMAIWNFIINLPYTSAELAWAYGVLGKLSDAGLPFSTNLLRDRPYHGAVTSLKDGTVVAANHCSVPLGATNA